MRLSICNSSRTADLAARLSARLQRNLGIEVLSIEEDDAPVSETWEEGAAADALLILLDRLTAPAPLRLQDWKDLIDHDGDPPVAFLRFEDCAYPKLLDRRRCFSLADPVELDRAVERWLVSRLPQFPGIAPAPCKAEVPDSWWTDLVDAPGRIETADIAAAHAFAHLAARHFQSVVWIGCAGRDPALIRAEIAHRDAGGRSLFVLAHIAKPLPSPDGRHSWLQVTGAPPETDGDPALGACYAPAFPGWLARDLNADLSAAVLLDAPADLYRLPAAPRTNNESRRRHLEILDRYFQSWKQAPAPCRALLAEVPAALAYGFGADWPRASALARRAAFLLLAEGRRREAVRLLHQLLIAAGEHGDAETAEDARHELSWLTDDDEPVRAPVSGGYQLSLNLFGNP